MMKKFEVKNILTVVILAYLLIINYFGGYLNVGNWKILLSIDIVALLLSIFLLSNNFYLAIREIKDKHKFDIMKLILISIIFIMLYSILGIWIFDVFTAIRGGEKYYVGPCAITYDRGSQIRPMKGWKGNYVIFNTKKYIAPRVNFDKSVCKSDVEIYYLDGMNQVLRIKVK